LKLHIDQIGLVAELNVQMLLGLVTPPEFLQELITAGIPDKDARQIMTEINQKIFAPLREQMEKGPTVATVPVKSAAPRPVNAPVSSYAPRPAIVRQPADGGGSRPLNAPRSDAPGGHSAPQNVIAATSKQPVPQSRPVIPITPKPTANEKLLEDHEEPSPLLRTTASTVTKPIANEKLLEDHEEPSLPLKTSEGAARIEFKPIAPRAITTPANLPGAILTAPEVPKSGGLPKVNTCAVPNVQPAPIIPKVVPKVEPLIPPKPISSPIAPTVPAVPVTSTPAKPYSTDPYREPIDEK
jgi:hypothetical protein